MIDLRSDTVSKPTRAMRDAMAAADVGDDVFGDDPTVLDLESHTAELLGKEAAVFVSSGTQSNLCALLAHCQRGDEYLVGDRAHTYMFEGGGAAVLGSIQPQTVPMLSSGMLDLDIAKLAIKPDDTHFARTRLLCIENTTDGRVIGLEDLCAGRELADQHGLGYHLDGARLWNASIALGVAPIDIAAPFDTVSVCLSKGLGAPVGSVLVGSAPLITEARKWRKMLGGAMRQVGIIAAAGRHAIDNHIERLADDHRNAQLLAEGLNAIDGIELESQNTNMVFVRTTTDASGLEQGLLRRGVQTRWLGKRSRMVLHLDVDEGEIETVLTAIRSELNG
ncbi:MAG: low-specificity L-threonine aldolase [Acidimicrobiales bacterium]|nr:low-specificity L-threonine aldolase [Acidimicrobiales bacterium]